MNFFFFKSGKMNDSFSGKKCPKNVKIFAFCLALSAACNFFTFAEQTPALQPAARQADFIFMHDVHDFLDRLAQAKLIIDEQFKKNPQTFVLDAGDFSMGTLYQTSFAQYAPELRILGAIGVEATTFGNHEFDYGIETLAQMFETAQNARKQGEKLPAFTIANLDYASSQSESAGLFGAMQNYGVEEYFVLNHGDIKIAVFGINGKDSLFYTYAPELAWLDQIESAKKTVARIKQNEKVDMIVCLSHSGTNPNASKSEDQILARNVPEIDLIVSGHTHTVLQKPIIQGETAIVSCGAYSQNLGTVSLSQKENGRWQVKKYELVPVTDNLPKDPKIKEMLDGFARNIDENVLNQFGWKMNQIIALNSYNVDFYHEVGYLMADSMKKSVESLQIPPKDQSKADDLGYGYPVDVVIVPSGVVRDSFRPGVVTVKDVFNSYSLGMGSDGLPGYPLISVWLTGKDLRAAAEVDATVSKILDSCRLFTYGLAYEKNPRRLIFDKVTSVWLVNAAGEKTAIEDKKLYRVITDLCTGEMLSDVLKTSYGLISIVPRNAKGEALKNLNENIIYTGRGELKGWEAIAADLEKRGTVGDYSNAEAAAIIEKPSVNPVNFFARPSKAAMLIYGAVIVLLALIALAVLAVCRIIKKHRQLK